MKEWDFDSRVTGGKSGVLTHVFQGEREEGFDSRVPGGKEWGFDSRVPGGKSGVLTHVFQGERVRF